MRQILRPLLICGAVGALALSGCQKPGADAGAVRRALHADEAQLNADYKARDFNSIASHYASDATLMTPGTAVSGSESVGKALQSLLADPGLQVEFKAAKVGVSSSGDLAYARGSFAITLTDPATHRPLSHGGSYITVYRKQGDGAWKAIETIATLGATIR